MLSGVILFTSESSNSTDLLDLLHMKSYTASNLMKVNYMC